MQVDLASWLDKLSLVKSFEQGPEARVTSQLDKYNLSSWLVKFHLCSNAKCRTLPLSQTHISKRVFMNEISSSALLDTQLTLLDIHLTVGCNNCGHARPQLSAIYVTKKNILQAFVIGFRNGRIWALSQLSLCIQNSDLSFNNYFLISVQFFPRMAPHFFDHHDSPSNLASNGTSGNHVFDQEGHTIWFQDLRLVGSEEGTGTPC